MLVCIMLSSAEFLSTGILCSLISFVCVAGTDIGGVSGSLIMLGIVVTSDSIRDGNGEISVIDSEVAGASVKVDVLKFSTSIIGALPNIDSRNLAGLKGLCPHISDQLQDRQ